MGGERQSLEVGRQPEAEAEEFEFGVRLDEERRPEFGGCVPGADEGAEDVAGSVGEFAAEGGPLVARELLDPAGEFEGEFVAVADDREFDGGLGKGGRAGRSAGLPAPPGGWGVRPSGPWTGRHRVGVRTSPTRAPTAREPSGSGVAGGRRVGSAGGEPHGPRSCCCGCPACSCCGWRSGSSWRCCSTSRRAGRDDATPTARQVSAAGIGHSELAVAVFGDSPLSD